MPNYKINVTLTPSASVECHPFSSDVIYATADNTGNIDLTWTAASAEPTRVVATYDGVDMIEIVIPDEVVPPYVAPVISLTTGDGEVIDGKTMRVISPVVSNPNFTTDSFILELDSDTNVYLFNYVYNGSGLGYILISDANTGSFGTEYVRFRTDSGQIFLRLDGSNNTVNGSGSDIGACVVDTSSTTISFYDSTGNKINTVDWSVYGAFDIRNTYLNYAMANIAEGETLTAIYDKDDFVVPIQNDLSTDLNGVDWKQVGEV